MRPDHHGSFGDLIEFLGLIASSRALAVTKPNNGTAKAAANINCNHQQEAQTGT